MEWRRAGSPRHERIKMTQFQIKITATILWDSEKIFLTDLKYCDYRHRIVLRFLNVSLEGYAIKEKQCHEL